MPNERDRPLELTPCKVKALVCQETQRELQAREEEEVGEIDQAQHSKFLHSWQNIFNSCKSAKVQQFKRTLQHSVCATYFLL